MQQASLTPRTPTNNVVAVARELIAEHRASQLRIRINAERDPDVYQGAPVTSGGLLPAAGMAALGALTPTILGVGAATGWGIWAWMSVAGATLGSHVLAYEVTELLGEGQLLAACQHGAERSATLTAAVLTGLTFSGGLGVTSAALLGTAWFTAVPGAIFGWTLARACQSHAAGTSFYPAS